MSQSNIETIRRLFEAVGAVARAMWERWDGAWEEMQTVPEEFIERLFDVPRLTSVGGVAGVHEGAESRARVSSRTYVEAAGTSDAR
jgi:hypothetical protein